MKRPGWFNLSRRWQVSHCGNVSFSILSIFPNNTLKSLPDMTLGLDLFIWIRFFHWGELMGASPQDPVFIGLWP